MASVTEKEQAAFYQAKRKTWSGFVRLVTWNIVIIAIILLLLLAFVVQ